MIEAAAGLPIHFGIVISRFYTFAQRADQQFRNWQKLKSETSKRWCRVRIIQADLILSFLVQGLQRLEEGVVVEPPLTIGPNKSRAIVNFYGITSSDLDDVSKAISMPMFDLSNVKQAIDNRQVEVEGKESEGKSKV